MIVGVNMLFPLRFTAIHLIHGFYIIDSDTIKGVRITGTTQLLYYTLKVLYNYDFTFFKKKKFNSKNPFEMKPSDDKRIDLAILINVEAFLGTWTHLKVLLITHTIYLIFSPFRILWFWYAYIRILITRKTKEKFLIREEATGNVAYSISLEDLNSVIYKSTINGLSTCVFESFVSIIAFIKSILVVFRIISVLRSFNKA